MCNKLHNKTNVHNTGSKQAKKVLYIINIRWGAVKHEWTFCIDSQCLVSVPGSMEVFPHIDLKEGKIEGQPGGSALLNIAKL